MENTNAEKLSQEELYKQQTMCPSCGRFVGTYTRCPYCQALTQKRLSIRIFKYISVLTSTFGLLLLLFFARNIKTQKVNIADLGPLSNFAHVRIEGVVTKSYGLHPKWKSLAFVVAQGRGEKRKTIRISAYSKTAKKIAKEGKIPNEGDLISVEGQVRFQKETPSLLINAPELLVIKKRAKVKKQKKFELVKVSPNEVKHELLGRFVTVTGSVITTKSFDSGTLVSLDNGKSGLPVWIPKNCLPDEFNLAPGDLISATGKVETFKGKLEVKVNRKGSVRVISKVSPLTDGGN